MTKRHTYASTVLTAALRKEGLSCQCLWEVRGPKGTAWLTCYMIRADGGYLRPLMVQTYELEVGQEEPYWEAWVPAYEGVEVDKTVQAVLRYTKRTGSSNTTPSALLEGGGQ
jgi:hypothetical protein